MNRVFEDEADRTITQAFQKGKEAGFLTDRLVKDKQSASDIVPKLSSRYGKGAKCSAIREL